jgi:hypothetical protein
MPRHCFSTSITPQHVMVNCACGWTMIAGRKLNGHGRRMQDAMQRHRDAIAEEAEAVKRAEATVTLTPSSWPNT